MKIRERSWTGPHLDLRNALRRIEAGTVTAKPIIGRDLRLSLSKLAVLDRPCRALAGRPVHRKSGDLPPGPAVDEQTPVHPLEEDTQGLFGVRRVGPAHALVRLRHRC